MARTEETADLLARAVGWHQDGRLDEAEAAYRRILEADPRQADAHHLLGLIAFQRGRQDHARAAIARAIDEAPERALFHANLGRVCRAAGALHEAVAAWRRALELDPDQAEVLSDLGGALVHTGDLDGAEAACRRAAALAPGLAETHYNLGLALQARGHQRDAAGAFRQAARCRAGFADAHYHLGLALHEDGDLDGAAEAYRAALAGDPRLAEAHCNLGNVLRARGRADEAVACYERSLALAPDVAETHGNLGVALQDLGRLEEAGAAYDRALELNPDDAETRRNRAMWLLLHGRFAEGWAEYEWRWRARALARWRRDFDQPSWDGSDLAGRTILVHAEQGLGDTLQFVRYLPQVAARGGRVVFECQPPLRRLLDAVAGADAVVAKGETLPAFDVHVPLLSLPGMLETTAETVPAAVPYLRAHPTAADRWRRRLAVAPGLAVGLCWQGNPAHVFDHARSLALDHLSPLWSVPGVRVYGLQMGAAGDQARHLPPSAPFEDLTAEFADGADLFSEDAAVMEALDLVVTVDTAVAHLAGALGRSVWILLPAVPDWRWLLDRDDSPWYPTARLFRQDRYGHWEGAVDRLAAALAARAQSE